MRTGRNVYPGCGVWNVERLADIYIDGISQAISSLQLSHTDPLSHCDGVESITIADCIAAPTIWRTGTDGGGRVWSAGRCGLSVHGRPFRQ